MRLSLLLHNSKVDTFYRSVLLSKFFIKGWGLPSNLRDIFTFRKILSNREKCQSLVDKHHPIYIDKCVAKTSDYNLFEGHFMSPLVDYLPVPESCKISKFQLIEPTIEKLKKINLDDKIRPVVIHLAGTGDHWYWKRRQFMAKPLLDFGITSIIVENPYYGGRRPKNQKGSCLLNVEDLFIMGGCLVLECLVLLYFLERSG